MDLAAIPHPNPAVVYHEDPGGEVVMVNLDTGASLVLNPTGFMVWQMVDGRRTIAQIVATMYERFPDAPPEVDEDVGQLMAIWVEDGFVGFELARDAVSASGRALYE